MAATKKRSIDSASSPKSPAKKMRKPAEGVAAPLPAEMAETPLAKLFDALKSSSKVKADKPAKDGFVVYWQRNKDIRLKDNTALAHASAYAQEHSIPLVMLHIFSTGDYRSHHRSPRRIDFQLRQMAWLQRKLVDEYHVPLYTIEWDKRKKIPDLLLAQLEEWEASALFANLEYEVDELRRDTEILDKVTAARQEGKGWKGHVTFLSDFCVVKPGDIVTQQGKPYSVFSPWYKNWSATVNANPLEYLDDAGTLTANDEKVAHAHKVISKLFEHKVPKAIKGFELDKEDQEAMNKLWPVGEDIAEQIMHRFIYTKSQRQKFFEPPLADEADEVKDPRKDSKIAHYPTGRNDVSLDGTSHISPYLAAGFISPRECLRLALEIVKGNKLPVDRSDGVGMWGTEVAWRDFYQHLMCAYPRVSMGQNFNKKFDGVVWEYNDEDLQRWKDGKTGYPIVDAAMRALKKQGYTHNRNRMIVAMFLDLMHDWREGEKYFSEMLVDCDLGSNNGGWQWSASTGADPQPYFRIFNMKSQGEKSDSNGDYVKYWVPELADVPVKNIHEPTSAQRKKAGYPEPMVDHKESRERALRRFKEPGSR